MFLRFSTSRQRQRGVALVITLALIVLLTGLVVAMFSRALSERQISNSSANAVRVDLFAQDALATTLGDLRQEIAAGSVQPFPTPAPTPLAGGIYLYNPKTPAAAMPCPAGTTLTAAPNLLKRSANTIPFYTGASYDITNYPPSNRASTSSSTAASQNGRKITPARWNKSLLLPKKDPNSDTDYTPVNAYLPPDWVVVARDGSNPKAWNGVLSTNGTNPAVGRYAYNIYDEGGLLDMNAAGYPDVTGVASPQINDPTYKSSLAFADLKQLPGIATTALDSAGNTIAGLSPARQEQIVRTLVGWRNYASTAIDLTQTPPVVSSPVSGRVDASPGYTWSNNPTSGNIFNYLGFLRSSDGGFLYAANRQVVNHQTDRLFASRQQLMNLVLNSVADQSGNGTAERAALQNAMQYLGTFTRSLNQPSYAPVSRVLDAKANPNPRPTILPSFNTNDPTKGGGNNVGDNYAAAGQDSFSPSFLALRAQGVYKRNDDTTDTAVGEPLVKTRFALQRLAWLTYLGPSSTRSIPLTNPGVDSADYDMWQLVNNYGISKDFLAQGTARHIERSFGLEWEPTKHLWKYDLHNINGAAAGNVSGATGVIRRLDDLAALKTREPDFFELLKASVDPGSIAKASILYSLADLTEGVDAAGKGNPLAPLNFQFNRDVAYDAAIMQLGANIIDQFDTDGYPTRITFDDGSGKPAREFRGVENLPYIYRVRLGMLRVREPVPLGYAGKRNAGSTDYANDGCTPELHSGPVPPASGYTPNPLKDTGVGVLLAIPDIWNPHDQNASMGSPRPGLTSGSFRVIASSASPDVIASTTPTYSTVTVGGGVVSCTNLGRYKGSSYQPLGNGGGGAEPPGSVPAGAVAPFNAPVPVFSRIPTPDGTGGVPMSGSNGGYNNPQVITSVPLPNAIPPVLAATSSTLSFSVPNATLFREPTLLARPDTTSGSGLSMSISNPDATGVSSTTGPTMSSGGFISTATNLNPLGLPGTPPPTQPYIGLYLGVFPLRWVGSRWSLGPYISPSTTFWVYTDGFVSEQGGPTKSITYSLQCLDPAGNWVSYDEKYVNSDSPAQWVPSGILMDGIAGNYVFVDPRASRFGAPDEQYRAFDSPHYHAPTGTGWLDNNTNVFVTERPDIHAGFGGNHRGTYGTSVDWGNWAAAGWHYKNVYGGGVNSIFFETGLLAQNNPAYGSDGLRFQGDAGVGATDAQFYTDPDGVVRRGMAAYITSTTSAIGQPLATASTYTAGKASPNGTQNGSRPKMLNRPFRSVAELGYVFSGTPWKNLDFSTPESGYSELLDVFCVNDTNDSNGLVAGRLNVNTRQAPVLAAVLSGAAISDPNTATPTTLTASDATDIAKLLVKRTLVDPTSSTGNKPMANIGDLVGKWVGKQTLPSAYSPALSPSHNLDGSKSYDGFGADIALSAGTALTATNPIASPIEAQRETVVRALASVGNTRVWNLLIDVIAQTGRYPSSATTLDNFVVEGEQRCWMHVAIDRATGQVVDSKLEIVKE